MFFCQGGSDKGKRVARILWEGKRGPTDLLIDNLGQETRERINKNAARGEGQAATDLIFWGKGKIDRIIVESGRSWGGREKESAAQHLGLFAGLGQQTLQISMGVENEIGHRSSV